MMFDWLKKRFKRKKKVGLSRAQLAKEFDPGLNVLFRLEHETAKPDTRIDARDLEFARNVPLQQEGPMIPLREAGLQKVPKWCHAPKEAGKFILCPVCGARSHVYRFRWRSLRCESCDTDVEKYDWYLAPAAAPEE